MGIGTWLSFALVALVVSLVPGPACVTVLSSSIRSGWRSAPFTIAGILVGDAIFFAIASLGLGAVLVSWHAAFVALKWVGIAYLTYLGLRSILDAKLDLAGSGRQTSQGMQGFSYGLTTQLANPKIIVFLGALVPQFVNQSAAAAPQFAIMGVTFIVSDALVFGIESACAARARKLLATPRAARITSRVSGAAMLAVAGRIAIER